MPSVVLVQVGREHFNQRGSGLKRVEIGAKESPLWCVVQAQETTGESLERWMRWVESKAFPLHVVLGRRVNTGHGESPRLTAAKLPLPAVTGFGARYLRAAVFLLSTTSTSPWG